MIELEKQQKTNWGKIINNIARLVILFAILALILKSLYVYHNVSILEANVFLYMVGMFINGLVVMLICSYIINVVIVYVPEILKWLITGKFRPQRIFYHEVVKDIFNTCKRNIII